MMARFVTCWAVAGLVVPLAVLGVSRLTRGILESPELVMVLWPSWILNGAVAGAEGTGFALSILVLSVGANVVWYAGIGSVVWLAWRLLARVWS